MSGASLSRRCRIQARPNVVKIQSAKKPSSQQQQQQQQQQQEPNTTVVVDELDANDDKRSIRPTAAKSPTNFSDKHLAEPQMCSTPQLISSESDCATTTTTTTTTSTTITTTTTTTTTASTSSTKAPQSSSPIVLSPPALASASTCDGGSSEESSSHDVVSPKRSHRSRHRKISQSTSTSSATNSKARDSMSFSKRFTGEEPLDPKTMTMFDMIWWNPKNDTALKNHDNTKKENKEMDVDEWKKQQEEEKRRVQAEEASKKIAAPQVKIAEDGSLVVDESSLTITREQSSSAWETVNEDRIGRKVTSMSFRKRAWHKGTPWSVLETDLFYDILRATGPDFGLMHEFFPSRARSELKSKFNREERTNLARLNEAMSSPTVLNESLFTHANELLQKIGEETLKKKEQKMTKKERLAFHAAQQAECEEDEQGVESTNSTAVRITVVDSDERYSSAKNASKSSSQTEEPDDESSANWIIPSILNEFDVEFPRFKLIEEENATAVSLERIDNDLPLIRVPPKTVLHALQRDDNQPERILFDCPATDQRPAMQFLVQQRLGPLEPPSGFLHLFGPPK